MDKLLNLLKDGHARTTLMLAQELNTSPADIRRKLEFLERMGILKRVSMKASGSCESCAGCSSKGEKSGCGGCIPDAQILNMGEMWEVG